MPSLVRRLVLVSLVVALATLTVAALALHSTGALGQRNATRMPSLLVAAGVAVAAGAALAAVAALAAGRSWAAGLQGLATRIDTLPQGRSTTGPLPAPLPAIREFHLLAEVIEQAAASLAREQQRAERQGRALHQMVETAIRDGVGLAEMLERVTPALAAATDAEAMVIVRDPGEGRLEVAHALGMSAMLAQRLCNPGTGGEPGIRRAIEAGAPVTTLDILNDPLYATRRSALSFGRLRSATCVPILSDGHAIGGIAIYRRAALALTDEQLDTVEKAAAKLGLAFNQERLAGEVQTLSLDVVQALVAAIDAMDQYTAGHTDRVVSLCAAVGHHLGLRGHALEMLRFAAALHDVGKLGVRPEVLRKPGRLDPDEWEEMKRHVVFSAQIVEQVRALRDVVPIVYHHHERYDGRGYPAGLPSDEIPLGSRIIHVVDAFDAMTTDRPYRKALSADEAFAELHRYAGTDFDPAVVRAFVQVTQIESAELAGAGD